MKKTNIRKLKQKELKSRKDSRLNKMLLRKRKQKKHKAERKLLKQNKINRSQMNKKGEVSRKRRMRFALICSTIIFLGLATRVGYIQFFEGEKLQQMAYLQQTLNRNINIVGIILCFIFLHTFNISGKISSNCKSIDIYHK